MTPDQKLLQALEASYNAALDAANLLRAKLRDGRLSAGWWTMALRGMA